MWSTVPFFLKALSPPWIICPRELLALYRHSKLNMQISKSEAKITHWRAHAMFVSRALSYPISYFLTPFIPRKILFPASFLFAFPSLYWILLLNPELTFLPSSCVCVCVKVRGQFRKLKVSLTKPSDTYNQQLFKLVGKALHTFRSTVAVACPLPQRRKFKLSRLL